MRDFKQFFKTFLEKLDKIPAKITKNVNNAKELTLNFVKLLTSGTSWKRQISKKNLIT